MNRRSGSGRGRGSSRRASHVGRTHARGARERVTQGDGAGAAAQQHLVNRDFDAIAIDGRSAIGGIERKGGVLAVVGIVVVVVAQPAGGLAAALLTLFALGEGHEVFAMLAEMLAGSTPTDAERIGFAQRAVVVHAVHENFGRRFRGALGQIIDVAAGIVPSTHLECGAGQLGRSVAREHRFDGADNLVDVSRASACAKQLIVQFARDGVTEFANGSHVNRDCHLRRVR